MTRSAPQVGEIVNMHGPAAIVILEPGASVGVGQRLDVRDGTLGVIAQFSEEELCCVRIAGSARPGDRVTDPGQQWSRQLDADAMNALAAALAPPAATRALLDTGLKAIDFLCPLRAGGSLVVLGGPSVGKTLVPIELVTRLGETSSLRMHLPVARPLGTSLPVLRKECVLEGLSAFDRIGAIELFWTQLDAAGDPGYASGTARTAFDAVLYLSVAAASRGMYPAIDPIHCGSRALREGWVEPEHVDTHAAFLDALGRHRLLTADALYWELLAQGARVAAQARWTEVETSALGRASHSDRSLIERVRKIERYLTQPFYCATPYTGIPGSRVPRLETVRTVAAILRGDFDYLDAPHFYLKGSVKLGS